MEKLRKFNLEDDYLDIKESLEYPTLSLTDDNGKVWVKSNLCSFTISGNHGDDVTFNFEDGMTWNDFINSKYNVPTCSNDIYDVTFYYFENTKEIQMCHIFL